jgi:hypothetical protein
MGTKAIHTLPATLYHTLQSNCLLSQQGIIYLVRYYLQPKEYYVLGCDFVLPSCWLLPWGLILKMEAVCFSEMSVNFYEMMI